MSSEMVKRAALTLALAAGVVTSAHATLVTGNIAVYEGSTLEGYVSDAYDSQNSYTYTSNQANAINVQIDTSAPVFSILVLNPPISGPNSYFGAVGGSGGYVFGTSSSGYAYLAGTSFVAAGSVPSSSASTSIQSLGYNAGAESSIWSLSGNVLTAQWTNSDSTAHAATAFYDPVVNYLGLTSNLAGYNSTYGDGAPAVTFKFTGALSTAVPEPSSLAILAGALAIGAVRRRRAAR